jgi:hypothetical protein
MPKITMKDDNGVEHTFDYPDDANVSESSVDRLVMPPDFYKVDFRTREIQTREERDGNKMLMQSRVNIINDDGSVEYGDWRTGFVIKNYGDCFDKKPSLLYRLFGLA